MAEQVVYDDSPLSQFLHEVGEHEHSTLDTHLPARPSFPPADDLDYDDDDVDDFYQEQEEEDFDKERTPVPERKPGKIQWERWDGWMQRVYDASGEKGAEEKKRPSLSSVLLPSLSASSPHRPTSPSLPPIQSLLPSILLLATLLPATTISSGFRFLPLILALLLPLPLFLLSGWPLGFSELPRIRGLRREEGARQKVLRSTTRLVRVCEVFDEAIKESWRAIGGVEGTAWGIGIGGERLPPISRLESSSLAPITSPSDSPPIPESPLPSRPTSPDVPRRLKRADTTGLFPHRCFELRKTLHETLTAAIVTSEATTRALEGVVREAAPERGEEHLHSLLDQFGIPFPPPALAAKTVPGTPQFGHSRNTSVSESTSGFIRDHRERDREQFLKALWAKTLHKDDGTRAPLSAPVDGPTDTSSKRAIWNGAGSSSSVGHVRGSSSGRSIDLHLHMPSGSRPSGSGRSTPVSALPQPSKEGGSPERRGSPSSLSDAPLRSAPAGSGFKYSFPRHNRSTSSTRSIKRLDRLFEHDDEGTEGMPEGLKTRRPLAADFDQPEPTEDVERSTSLPSALSSFRDTSQPSGFVFPPRPSRSSPTGDGADVRDPLLLKNLKDDFGAFHRDRKRALCCLVALDHLAAADTGGNTDGDQRRWMHVDSVVCSLVDALESMRENVVRAYESEFGDDSFQAARAVSQLASRSDPGLAASRLPPGAWPMATSPHSTPAAIQGFAPPNPKALPPREAALQDLSQHAIAVTSALRSAATKLHVAIQDSKRLAVGGDQDDAWIEAENERILALHESVKEDLERSIREWQNSRLVVRRALRPPLAAATVPLQVESDDDLGADDSRPPPKELVEGEEPPPFAGSQATVFSSQPLLPADEQSTPSLGTKGVEQLSDLLLQSTSAAYLPPPGAEHVYEGVAGLPDSGAKKLSREERIRLAKDKRVAMVAAAVETPEEHPAGMVKELKDVLDVMRQRRGTLPVQQHPRPTVASP